MWVVRHEGQDQTCFKCLGTGHMSRGCSEVPFQFGKECRLAAKAWRAKLLLAAEDERIARNPQAAAEQERLRQQEEQARIAAVQQEVKEDTDKKKAKKA